MRIVGGQWRGRPIRPPKGETTRPTTDRVREALFSAIASRIGSDMGEGAVLDAFAGSGALGLEALSRGASAATFVEHHRGALSALKANIDSLGATSARVVGGDVFALAARGIGGPFSLILLDPPYTLDQARIESMLVTLADAGAVADGALVTWEHAAGDDPAWPDGYEFDARKRYGSTEIDFAMFGRGVR